MTRVYLGDRMYIDMCHPVRAITIPNLHPHCAMAPGITARSMYATSIFAVNAEPCTDITSRNISNLHVTKPRKVIRPGQYFQRARVRAGLKRPGPARPRI